MNGRVYDPVTGRFLSADPNVFHPFDTMDFNRYSYVWNNPLKYTDPSGYGGGYGQDVTESYGDTNDFGGEGKLRDLNDPLSPEDKKENRDRLGTEKAKELEAKLKEYKTKQIRARHHMYLGIEPSAEELKD